MCRDVVEYRQYVSLVEWYNTLAVADDRLLGGNARTNQASPSYFGSQDWIGQKGEVCILHVHMYVPKMHVMGFQGLHVLACHTGINYAIFSLRLHAPS